MYPSTNLPVSAASLEPSPSTRSLPPHGRPNSCISKYHHIHLQHHQSHHLLALSSSSYTLLLLISPLFFLSSFTSIPLPSLSLRPSSSLFRFRIRDLVRIELLAKVHPEGRRRGGRGTRGGRRGRVHIIQRCIQVPLLPHAGEERRRERVGEGRRGWEGRGGGEGEGTKSGVAGEGGVGFDVVGGGLAVSH